MQTRMHNNSILSNTKNFFTEAFRTLMEYVVVPVVNRPLPSMSCRISTKQKIELQEILKPGDIILGTNNIHPGWSILEKITTGTNWTHSGLYVGNGYVIHSSPSYNGVTKIPLPEYLNTNYAIALRPDYKTSEDVSSSINYAHKILGRPYDSRFILEDDNKLYCSELVYNALQKGPNPITDIPVNDVMGNKGVSPDAFLKTPSIKKIWSNGEAHLLKDMLTHWPVLVGTAVGGFISGGIGAVLGTIGISLLGNHLQGNYTKSEYSNPI